MRERVCLPIDGLPAHARQLALVNIPPGDFQMGSGPEEKGHSPETESPSFRCRLQPGFWMGECAITQAQFAVIAQYRGLDPSPSLFSELPDSQDRPVESVPWTVATRFCEILNEIAHEILPDGYEIGLPTEAMWEYSCRSGSEGRYCCGDSDEDLLDFAWFAANSGGTTHPVGEKQANEFGLYDMHGNVLELCQDEFELYSTGNKLNWVGQYDSSVRVMRGGSWKSAARYCGLRSASRCEVEVSDNYPFLGFRICASVGKERVGKERGRSSLIAR